MEQSSQRKGNDVQDCSWTATCDDLSLWAPSRQSKLNHYNSNDSLFPTYELSSRSAQIPVNENEVVDVYSLCNRCEIDGKSCLSMIVVRLSRMKLGEEVGRQQEKAL